MKIICKHLGPYYEIQKMFPCRAFANEFIGELWVEIDEKYDDAIELHEISNALEKSLKQINDLKNEKFSEEE